MSEPDAARGEGGKTAASDWAVELLANERRLNAWLTDRLSHAELSTNGLLGTYDPTTATLALHSQILAAVAPLVGIPLRYLKSVVFMHLSVLAYAHQALDLDGNRGYGFAQPVSINPLIEENRVHAVIAQHFVSKLLDLLGDSHLSSAFEKLDQHQPLHYRRWRHTRMRAMERMRATLLRARGGEAIQGLP